MDDRLIRHMVILEIGLADSEDTQVVRSSSFDVIHTIAKLKKFPDHYMVRRTKIRDMTNKQICN